ncbi:MAG: peptidylprolyl isomerase [Verrucomicrobiales bacterium]
MPETFVNHERIDPDLIEQEFRAIKSHCESLGKVSCCERDPEFRNMARDNLVARVLLNQEANRRQLEVGESEIDEALGKLEAEHGGRDQFLQNLGLNPCQIDLVRDDIRNGLRVEKTLRACLGPMTEPAADEVRAFYEENIKDYMTEEEVMASHLFKQVPKVEDRQRIYNELREIRRQALKGADFDQLALEHTDKEDKLIDLGWFKQGDFMDEFSVIAFSLEEDEVSPVFASYFGFHLCKCTGRRVPTPKPFEEVQDEVRARMISEDQQRKSQSLVEQLKSRASIEEREESEAGEPLITAG